MFKHSSQVWIALLAQGFVNHDGGAVRQIQRADVFGLRDAQTILRAGLGKFLRQPRGFAAKQKVNVLRLVAEIMLAKRHIAVGFNQKNLAVLRFGVGDEGLQIIVVVDVYMSPVIQTCAFEHFVIGGKPQWAYQMQAGVGACASAGDVACVGGNFGLV